MTTNTNPPLSTLQLDSKTWDLVLDAEGNLAVAQPPASSAQDIASQLRTWLGECYYDTTQGLPLEQAILGQRPTIGALNAMITTCALQVPGIATVTPNLTVQANGTLTGTVGFTTTDSTTGSISL